MRVRASMLNGWLDAYYEPEMVFSGGRLPLFCIEYSHNKRIRAA